VGLAVKTNKENNNKNKDKATKSMANSLLSSRYKFQKSTWSVFFNKPTASINKIIDVSV
jgi:hypothetical protein